MRRSLLDSPLRLTIATILGGFLSTVGFVGANKSSETLVRILASFGLVLVGVIGLYWSSYTLREGIQNERWPAIDIDPLSRIVNHPVWTLFLFISVIAMVGALIVQRSHQFYFWGMFLLVQTMSQLRGCFRPSVTRSPPSARIDWTRVPSLHSDHWGER